MIVQESAPSTSTLLALLAGHRVTAIIYVAAKLGIADLVAEGPKTVVELARLTNTHERSLLRLMRALVALNIVSEKGDGKFEPTEMGGLLAAKSERSLRAWALVEGEMLRAAWGQLIESIHTGKTGGELAGLGSERFELLAETKDAALFNEGMVSITRATAPALLAAYDFAGISTLMDVGGGVGEFMCSILKKYPSMHGIVFDLQHCADGASKQLADSGVADRCEFVAGSFFDSVPAGAESIVMKSIVHDWNDERCVTIFANCRRALKPGARLIVIDRVMPDKLEPRSDHLSVVLSDLNMLRGPGGCERTEREHRELLAKGGFQLTRVVTAGPLCVMEATVS